MFFRVQVRRVVLAALLFYLIAAPQCGTAFASSPPLIVVTIKPLHSLVAGITEGVVRPKLLLDNSASPHTYALRPSDGGLLQDADVVVRISENLETFLNRPLQTLSGKARIIAADRAPGITLLPVRGSGTFENKTPDAPPPDADAADVHIWLDAANASAIVDYVAETLSEVDPAHAPQYKSNAVNLKGRLAVLDRELMQMFKSDGQKPFILFHDVTQYLERRYGLHAAAAITVSPERQPGANRLAAIRAKIQELGAVCIFAEPQFPPQLVETLAEGTSAKRGSIDEVGGAIPPGPEHYFTFMHTLSANIADCLSH